MATLFCFFSSVVSSSSEESLELEVDNLLLASGGNNTLYESVELALTGASPCDASDGSSDGLECLG